MKLQNAGGGTSINYNELFDGRHQEDIIAQDDLGKGGTKEERRDDSDSNLEVNSGDEAQKPLINKVRYLLFPYNRLRTSR